MLGKNESFPFAEKLSILCSFTLSPPPYCKVFFKTSCLKWGRKNFQKFRGRQKFEGGQDFCQMMGSGITGRLMQDDEFKFWRAV